jgi:hypothetical protein
MFKILIGYQLAGIINLIVILSLFVEILEYHIYQIDQFCEL